MKIFVLLLLTTIESIPICLNVDENENQTGRSFSSNNSSCSLISLNEIEDKMIIPFEFRRLHIEQPDHRTKYLQLNQHQTFINGSTVVYEHRSHPDGVRYCRNCHDGKTFFFLIDIHLVFIEVFGHVYQFVKSFVVMLNYFVQIQN